MGAYVCRRNVEIETHEEGEHACSRGQRERERQRERIRERKREREIKQQTQKGVPVTSPICLSSQHRFYNPPCCCRRCVLRTRVATIFGSRLNLMYILHILKVILKSMSRPSILSVEPLRAVHASGSLRFRLVSELPLHHRTARIGPIVSTRETISVATRHTHQVIPVWVNFSFPVVVVVGAGASPPLLTVGGFNGSVNGSMSTALAEFVGGSGTSQLLFEYTVRYFRYIIRTCTTLVNRPPRYAF